jgi:hypothetical protein
MIEPRDRDDWDRLRWRQPVQIVREPDWIGGGIPAFVGQVTSLSTSIGVGKFFLAQPIFVLGQESEGASGDFNPVGTSTVAVYLLGPGLPVTGDYLVCKFVDNRWVAERSTSSGGTGGTGTLPDCFCTPIPATLTMTSADPECNFQMFQSCTIQYAPTPAGFAALNLGANTFISTASFPDPIAGGALFFYLLFCQGNQFSLTRLYLESPYGSPFRDGVLYTWLVGGSGNTCSPFHLDAGTAFPGSDASCFVTIDAD